jgi:lipopolysaccharide/colanic/teichoic acid biosynthesis glycosyltransferase
VSNASKSTQIYSQLKRVFDFVLALVALVFLSPLWVLIWVAIVIEDGVPVFIKQRRVGKDGRIFDYYKFRSMIKSSLAEETSIQAKPCDQRITKIGRLIRNTAMDESPQLFNILLGEMSFVGPRPLLLSEVEVHGSDNCNITSIYGFERRISILPGLTGPAQLYMPRDIPREKKFEYDQMYIREKCLLIDLKLIALSILVTLLGRWERRKPKLALLRKSDYDIK